MKALWLGLLIAGLLPVAAQSECQLRIRWTIDPPFSLQHADGSLGGLQVELAQAAFERMGCKLLWRRLPWARALRDLRSGELDVLMGTFNRPEREVYAWFSRPNRVSRNLLFVRSGEHARWDLEQLRDLRDTGFRLGAQIEVSYGAQYDELAADPAFRRRMMFVPHRAALWRMLQLQRIDGVIADEWTARYELQKLESGHGIAATRMVVSSRPVGEAFSKATVKPEFVTRYDQVIETMRRDGSFQAILSRHFPSP